MAGFFSSSMEMSSSSSTSTINNTMTLLDQPTNLPSFFSSLNDTARLSEPDSNTMMIDKKRMMVPKQQTPKEGKKMKKKMKTEEEEEGGFIHVRAKRGQATDSHSLAERMRRERISERMKLLQALVPGCDKVTGKAVMLDEIINYVQSLQNQIEFLSMKLASANPMYDFTMDLNHEQNWGGSPIFGGIQDTSNGCCYSNFINDSPNSVLMFRQNPNLEIRQDPTPARGDFMWELDDQVERYRRMEIEDNSFSFN